MGRPVPGVLALLCAAIMAAVYHAEVLAHYLGEPYGTLVLALAVTVIETSLIVSIMLSEGAGAQALARGDIPKVVLMSGFAPDTGKALPVPLLAKPFTRAELAAALQQTGSR